MNKEFLSIVEQLEREKGLPRAVLIEAVKQALTIAAHKIAKITEENKDEVSVDIDEQKGDIRVFISGKEIVSKEFGRIAAQTARQVIIQKIREAEKENIFEDFKDRAGQIIGGIVYRIEKRGVILDLLGKAEGIIPNSFLSPLDKFRMGERVKALVIDVKREKGPQIVLSRKHPGLVKKLFELEVPEIYDGIVEIKSIAREAGERTKIAVFSKDDKVDCVGSCVGIRGSRVKNIIEELRGEKIDIIRWHDEIKEFIKASLAPAAVSKIEIDRELKRAKVLVNSDQLSLAIGRKGQNVRLASRLVEWEIDVRTKEAIEESLKVLASLKSVSDRTATLLVNAGYSDVSSLARANEEDLAKIKGIGAKKVAKMVEEARKKVEAAKAKISQAVSDDAQNKSKKAMPEEPAATEGDKEITQEDNQEEK
ncbi:MAG: transcription termination/antitermination protein NusA [Candidatus Omnitrophica bacterium]|nr:transcription termination/antitermination protein NusA [Candidatus Omnitrophota bacterium]